MKILIINGANINMLGIREVQIYGKQDYNALKSLVKKHARARKINVKMLQSNCEGKLVDIIQSAYKKYDGIVINPGAYTHTSIALLDALKSVNIPTVEVHISDVASRERYRQISYVREVAVKTISGKGIDGYVEAIDFLIGDKK